MLQQRLESRRPVMRTGWLLEAFLNAKQEWPTIEDEDVRYLTDMQQSERLLEYLRRKGVLVPIDSSILVMY